MDAESGTPRETAEAEVRGHRRRCRTRYRGRVPEHDGRHRRRRVRLQALSEEVGHGGSGERRIPHLAECSVLTHGTCLARETPWLYFGFAVPDRTGGHIKRSAARSRYR